MLSFGPDDSQMCINVTILEDVNVEDDELFKLNLSSDDQAVLFSQNTAEVTITEDDDSELCITCTWPNCSIHLITWLGHGTAVMYNTIKLILLKRVLYISAVFVA